MCWRLQWTVPRPIRPRLTWNRFIWLFNTFGYFLTAAIIPRRNGICSGRFWCDRCPETAELIERLEKQHAEGARLINELDAAHKAFDAGFPAGLEELRAVVHAYVDFQREHIALEERELIPAARNHLGPADWGEINRAFCTDSDPLFDENMETGFRALSEKITR